MTSEVKLRHTAAVVLDKDTRTPQPSFADARPDPVKSQPVYDPVTKRGAEVLANLNPMQKHVAFFDLNGDGRIMPWETYQGFHRIGFPWPLAVLAAVLINGTMSYPSNPSWIPHPLFPVWINNIRRNKHGSDSEVYDNDAHFEADKFEGIFLKHDPSNKGGLTLKELWDLTENNKDTMDFYGYTAEKLEWGVTWWLLRDKKTGYVSKDRIRGVYDGTIWFQLANEDEVKRANKPPITLAAVLSSTLLALLVGLGLGAFIMLLWLVLATVVPTRITSLAWGSTKWLGRFSARTSMLPLKWLADVACTFWSTLPTVT
ncbi:hypothetical protein WJX72_003909 [[Myrmecia] bisecta]|uniref:Caleosin n=1 Tax=[Myrmecia] bisecta TaxID=41462 RepID=A0AAW1PH55_9CHLO